MERERNYDNLRVLATFMVVMLHVSAGYVTKNMDNFNLYFTVGNLFDSFSRYCVPLFVMLSGAFVLSNPPNRKFEVIYKNYCMTLFTQCCFGVLFILYI